MTVPYVFRLALLCLATFAFVYAAAVASVGLGASAAVHAARRMQARRGARLLLALRLAPAATGILVVAVFCIPSYLWLETNSGPERVNWICIGAVCFGLVVWLMALIRTGREVLHTLRWTDRSAGPVIALVGVIRPRVVVSRDVRRELPQNELQAALRHEEAHRAAHDNLKRLLISLAPGTFPGVAQLERGWATLAEWAADDLAAQGDLDQAVTLAGALVRVAKMGAGPGKLGLATPFAANGWELEARVNRLLNGTLKEEGRGPGSATAAVCLCGTGIAVVMCQPAWLSAVHELMEVFTR